MAIAPNVPNCCSNDTGPSCGARCQAGQCQAPSTEPAMKASSVTSMRTLPPPTVNRVPEAQPPPSCMPTPNRNAPAMMELLSGATEPRSAVPQISPEASNGMNTATVTPSITICARTPALRRSVIIARHAAVNPKAAW